MTLSDIAKNSSGNLYYYPEFNPRMHMTKFTNELYHALTRRMAWEAVFRIRLSHGFKISATYGNITIKAKTTDLVLCPVVDSERTVVYEIEKNDPVGGQTMDDRSMRRD